MRTLIVCDIVSLDGNEEGPGHEILVFGSHMLSNDLLAHGLVDELRLLGTRTWDGSGLLLHRDAAGLVA